MSLRLDLIPRGHKRRLRILGLALAVVMALIPRSGAWAAEAQEAADDPVLESRMMHVAAELRCLVCQNQTIADSHAGLAVDLRREIRTLLAQGKSDAEVLRFMTERYGDFVLYRPPVDARTWLLWFGPLALLGIAAGGLALHLRGRVQRPASDFEADPDDDMDGPATGDTAKAGQGVTP